MGQRLPAHSRATLEILGEVFFVLSDCWQRSIYSPFSSGIKALTYCLSSSVCSDVARSLDEDFDSSHSSAAFGLSFLSSRGIYGGLALASEFREGPCSSVGFKLTFSSRSTARTKFFHRRIKSGLGSCRKPKGKLWSTSS